MKTDTIITKKELPLRFLKDFYNYNGFINDIINKYDKRSPDFAKNVLMGYDIIRKDRVETIIQC